MEGKKWTLTKTTTEKDRERTNEKSNFWRIGSESWEFSGFDEARKAFRGIVRECAMEKGNTFDGDGNIRNLREYLGWIAKGVDEQRRNPERRSRYGSMMLRGAPDIAFMAGDFERAKALPDALRAWLLDMDATDTNPMGAFRWTDWSIGVVSKPGSLAVGVIHNYDRIELYDSQVFTDAFDMSNPDRSYEFSARPYFDAYDGEACSLRIRLDPGKTDGSGYFIWPEEDESEGWLFAEEAVPCLGGAFDSNFSFNVQVRPEEFSTKAERRELWEGYVAFEDAVISLAQERGLEVDRTANAVSVGRYSGSEISLYNAGNRDPWFQMRICMRFDGESWEDGKGAVEVEGVRFEGYADALGEISWIIDEYCAGNASSWGRDWRWQRRKAGSRC